MADNVELSAGSGGPIIAADDIGPGVWHQRVKIQHGADGSATDVSAASPLPVIGSSNSGVDIGDVTINNGVGASAVPIQDGGNSITVDGTVTAELSATDNAVLDNIDADTSAIQAAVELLDDAVVADDAAFTPATTKVVMAGFQFDDTLPDSVDEGDAGAARMSARREVYTQIRDAAGNERGAAVDASNRLTVVADLGATDNAVLDDIAAKLGTIDADTSALAGAISGTEVQVDIVTMPAVDTELTTADLDTGGGTDTRAVVGLVGSASGGGQIIPGSATDGLLVNLGSNNDVTVTGTVDLGATDNAVLDSIDADLTTIIGHVDGLEGLLTTIDADTSTLAAVDYATGADVASLGVTGGGAEATALRVTLASDSTGVVSVDDNGASLTVDNAGLTALNGAISGTEVQVDVVGALPAGTNAIGKLAANSGVDIGDVDVTSISAGTNVIGATLDVSGLMIENAVSVTVKYASIDAASSGDNTLVAAVTNKKIRVLSVFLVAAGAVNVRFESGAGGTALTGQMNLVANTGFVLPYNPHGWFQTADSTLLNLELSGAVSVDGSLTYIEAE